MKPFKVLPLLSNSTKTPFDQEEEEKRRRKVFEEFLREETKALDEEGYCHGDGNSDKIKGVTLGLYEKTPDEQMEILRTLENRFLQSSSVLIARHVLSEYVISPEAYKIHPLVRLEAFRWSHSSSGEESIDVRWRTVENHIIPLLRKISIIDQTLDSHRSYVFHFLRSTFLTDMKEELCAHERLEGSVVPLLEDIFCQKVSAVEEDFFYRALIELKDFLEKSVFSALMKDVWDRSSFSTETRIVWCQWLFAHPFAYDSKEMEKTFQFLQDLVEPGNPLNEAPCYVADAATLILDLGVKNEKWVQDPHNQDQDQDQVIKNAEKVLRDYYETGMSEVYDHQGTQRRSRTFYENQENVHCIEQESAQEILDFLHEDFVILPKHALSYYLRWVETSFQMFLSSDKSPVADKEKVILALYRIDKDWSRHGKHRHRLYDIFQMVVAYVEKYGGVEKDHDKKELTKRLLEELEEMSGTCSTGYAIRLLNVLSGYRNFKIRIPPEYALRCKLFHRLNNGIIEITQRDPERGSIIMDQMTLPSSHYSQRKEFLEFFRSQLPTLKENLYEEFKEMMTDTDYDFYLRKAIFSYEGCEGGF